MPRRTTTRRRASTPRTRRRTGRRTKPLYLGILGGLAGTAWSIWNGYKAARNAGYHPGEALMYVTAGYSPRSQTMPWDRNRVIETWAPLGVGYAVHEIIGNSRGAFGTGIGLQLNRRLKGRLKI